jgi:hypothetical protein
MTRSFLAAFGWSVLRGETATRGLPQLDHFQIIADLMSSRNGQLDRLSDLFQIIARHAAREDDEPRLDGNLDSAQRPVAGGAQGALGTFGQAQIFQALREQFGGHGESIRLSGRLGCRQQQQSAGCGRGAILLLSR